MFASVRSNMPPRDQYFDFVKRTYLESWPAEWRRVSCTSSSVQLTGPETMALGRAIQDWGQAFPGWGEREFAESDSQLLWGLEKRLHDLVLNLDKRAFVRLGSRSAKDSFLAHDTGPLVNSGKRALEMLTSNSERVYEDLCLAIDNEYKPHIWVRRWLDLDYPFEAHEKRGWSEFRCFVKDRELVGVSQYFYNRPYPVILQNAEKIKQAIDALGDHLIDTGHLDSFIFDAYVTCGPSLRHSGYDFAAHLLEVNPFFALTDPCLFDWREEFDGTMRVLDGGAMPAHGQAGDPSKYADAWTHDRAAFLREAAVRRRAFP
jgi:D123.